MTEEEWLACDNPQYMLVWLRRRRKQRKPRLFAVACCRRIVGLVGESFFLRAVEVAERYADRQATPKERLRHFDNSSAWREGMPKHAFTALAVAKCVNDYPFTASDAWDVAYGAADVLRQAIEPNGSAANSSLYSDRVMSMQKSMFEEQAGWVRDIFPFCPTLSALVLTPDIVSLARAAYDERRLPSGTLDPARLVVLSDALEDAGCTNTAVPSHLRSPGPHVRGCWSLDLILGKQ